MPRLHGLAAVVAVCALVTSMYVGPAKYSIVYRLSVETAGDFCPPGLGVSRVVCGSGLLLVGPVLVKRQCFDPESVARTIVFPETGHRERPPRSDS